MALLAVTAACLVLGAAADDFVWIGQGVDPDWDTRDNWHAVNEAQDPPYPETGDTAAFTWKAEGGWACNLITEEIGDMTIKGSVDFDTAGGTVTLEVSSLKIEPTSGDIEITMNGTAQIVVD
jgi:hypothetical protein